MSVKIYHNPRCGKSRAGLKAVQEAGIEPEIIKYLDSKPGVAEIMDILEKLNMKPIELVRIKEAIWKDNYKGKELSDKEVVSAMAENPKLMERPIVVKGDKAVLGRPTENISEFLK
jgi:arsenate reductase